MKKSIILITIIVLIIILIVALIFILGNTQQNNNREPYAILSLDEVESVEELVNKAYGDFIKQETSTEDGFVTDYYIDVDFGLVEDGVTKENFYGALIYNVAEKNGHLSFRIIDEEKETIIRVTCDSVNSKIVGTNINGSSDFYGQYNSQKALAEYEQTKTTEFELNEDRINTLISHSWEFDSLNLGDVEYTDLYNYDYYEDMKIRVKDTDKNVFNIVFEPSYDKEIVNNIKPGENIENVISILGEPTFGSIEENYIGYKGNEYYVFFSSLGQVSVYPVHKYDKSEYTQLLSDYDEGRSIKDFITLITDMWPDYNTYYYDEYTVDLQYSHKGIKFQFNTNEYNGILIYNNYYGDVFETYTMVELRDMEVEIPSYIYFVNEDSVNQWEYDRVQYVYSAQNEETSDTGDIDGLQYLE